MFNCASFITWQLGCEFWLNTHVESKNIPVILFIVKLGMNRLLNTNTYPTKLELDTNDTWLIPSHCHSILLN